MHTALEPLNGSAGPLLDAAAERASVSTFGLLRECGAPLDHPLHSAVAAHR